MPLFSLACIVVMKQADVRRSQTSMNATTGRSAGQADRERTDAVGGTINVAVNPT